MILILFIAAALGFFWTRVLWAPGRKRTIGVWLCGLVIVSCVVAIAANDAWHFGMKTTLRTHTAALAKRSIMAQPLGTKGTEVRYTYALAQAPQHPVSTQPSVTTQVRLRRQGDTGYRLVQDKTLHYSNGFAAFMFAFSGQDGYHLGRIVTLTVPANWTVTSHH